MSTLSTPGPIRTAKTPKRVRFVNEHERAQRQEAFERRDARALPRVDAEVSTHYDFSSLTAFGGAIADYAKNSLGSVVQLGKTALGKVIPSLAPAKKTTPKKQSMLEYPPFIAGATPNVVKKNRRDYYQSAEVLNSIRKAKAYDPIMGAFRTPEHLQSDKEKNWYRFHDTPYEGHRLDFSRKPRTEKPFQPVFQFNTPSKSMPTPSKCKSSRRSSTKKRTKSRLGTKSRRSNVEEFHANFVKHERNELYASYTKFLHTLRFDVKAFAKDLQDFQLPTKLILKLHDQAKRADWDFFLRIMADEEYWAQVKGVGNTKVPEIESYKKPGLGPNSRVNPCDYCKGQPWAGKVEKRQVENDGDLVERRGQSKFEIPYTPEEQSHIDGGRYYKVFHRFCHESRYDWKFPDPSKPCSWDGPDTPTAILGPAWSITKYDPRLRHFPLLMHKMPKRMRQHQIDLADMVKTLSEQDRSSWLYIQGIRRYNMRMADKLEKVDLERKRNQVLWPCQLQVEVIIKNKPLEPKKMQFDVTKEVESGVKRSLSLFNDKEESDFDDSSKRIRLDSVSKAEGTNGNSKRALVEDGADEEKEKDEPRKKMRVDDNNKHEGAEAATAQLKLDQKAGSGKFGLFFDNDESIDDNTIDEDAAKAFAVGQEKLNDAQAGSERTKPTSRMSFTEQIYNNIKERERELAEAEAQKAVAKPKTEQQEPLKLKQSDTSKIDFLFKQHFAPPIQQNNVPKPPPSKGFIFEDKVQEETTANVVDNASNALKEHRNGVKPSATSSLFGNAGTIPTLAPSGFGHSTAPEPSPLKSSSVPAKIVENEENIPQDNKTKEGAPAPLSFVFGSHVASTSTSATTTTTSLFAPAPSTSAPPLSSQAFSFGAFKADEPNKGAAPSLFRYNALTTGDEVKTAASTSSAPAFPFGAPKTEEQKSETAPSVFSGLTSDTCTETTRPNFQLNKPAPAEITKEPTTTTAPSLFSTAASLSAGTLKPMFPFGKQATETTATATATTTATSSAPSFMNTATAAPSSLAPAATAFTLTSFSAPTTTASNIFSAPAVSAAAQQTKSSSASTTSAPILFTTATTTASTTTAPSIFSSDAIKNAPKEEFVLGGGISALKPVESSASTSVPATAEAAASKPIFLFNGFSKPEKASISTIPPVFNFGGVSSAGSAGHFTFGASTAEPSKAPSAPMAPKSPAINRNSLSEDVSMASPEQSPEKQSPKVLFGAGAVTSGFNPVTKSLSFGDTIAAPSPLKSSSFGANQLTELSPMNFGPSISASAPQPANPVAPPALPGTPAKFEFTAFGPPATTPGPGTPTPAPAGTSGFNFEVDFSMKTNPPGRKIATPRPRRGRK